MTTDYKTLLTLFFDICLLRKGPQSLPKSAGLQQLVLLIYFVSSALLIVLDASWDEALIQVLIEVLLLGLFVYVLVTLFSVPERFRQSISAMYGCGAIITIISMPFVYWAGSLTTDDPSMGMVGLGIFVVICWSFVVMAHIIRETLEKNLVVSLLLSFCYVYLSYQVISFMYPIESL